jgi:hypothetical protein
LLNITTIVAQLEQGKSNENSTTTNLVAQFKYDQTTDTYTCPQAKRCIQQGMAQEK